MGSKNYLIDTNAVIDYLGGKLPASGVLFMDSVVDELPIISAIIAATALVYGFGLITRNVRDFLSIKGLTVIDPHGISPA